MIDRILRAIRLDAHLFREVADHPSYTSEATLLAIAVAGLSSLGVLAQGGNRAFLNFILQIGNQLLFGWILWGAVSTLVGTRFFGGLSNTSEMLRALAYASTPRLLGIVSFIPCLGPLAVVVGFILSLVAGIIAIREAMQFDSNKALLTALVGIIVYIVASIILGIAWSAVTLPFLR